MSTWVLGWKAKDVWTRQPLCRVPLPKNPGEPACKWKVGQSSSTSGVQTPDVTPIQMLLQTWFCQALHVQESQFWSKLYDYPRFLSVALVKYLNKKQLGERKGLFHLTILSRLQSITVEKSQQQEFETAGHVSSTIKSRGGISVFLLACLLACAQLKHSTHSSVPLVQSGATSINLLKTIPYRRAHRQRQRSQSFIETVCSGDSRLCKVDKANTHHDGFISQVKN